MSLTAAEWAAYQRRLASTLRHQAALTAARDPQLLAWVAYLDVDLAAAQLALRLPAGQRGWPPGSPEARPVPTEVCRPTNPLRDPAVVRIPPKGAFARRRAQ